MRSVFDIAKSHISLPVSKDVNSLRRVLRDWQHYTETLKLQEKATHSAALCVTVHPSRRFVTSNFVSPLSRDFFFQRAPQGETNHAHTKRVPMQLWTALLPWEVQRGLSMSELRLPRRQGTFEGQGEKREGGQIVGEEEDDPFGVVTASWTNARGTKGVSCAKTTTSPTTATTAVPGMIFVMDVDSAAQGVSFWSGAIMQPIDVAFIAPVEPVATSSTSFQRLRQRRLDAVEGSGAGGGEAVGASGARNYARFFPDGELDSPTVSFAVQSYSHLDPFPQCDTTGGTGERKHMAQPDDVDGGDGGGGRDNTRYVLETTRYLLRDSIAGALQEYAQLYGTVEAETKDRRSHRDGEEAVECTITLELSDELKEELREKARLYTNYVKPLEEHISYHIRRQNSSVPYVDLQTNKTQTCEKETKTGAKDSLLLCSNDSVPSPVAVASPTKTIICPSRVNAARVAAPAAPLRSPMLADETEALPSHLAPSVFGKHEATALKRAQKEQNQLISARALARYPNTSSHMPELPPIDYELFDLCLRLGLCQRDAIYYFYGRIMREWQKELLRLKKGGDGNSSEISAANLRRMLRVVRDPSLQVPAELSACVEAVVQRRGLVYEGESS